MATRDYLFPIKPKVLQVGHTTIGALPGLLTAQSTSVVMLVISQSGGLQTALETKSRTTALVLAQSIALEPRSKMSMTRGCVVGFNHMTTLIPFHTVVPIRSEPGEDCPLHQTGRTCTCSVTIFSKVHKVNLGDSAYVHVLLASDV